MHIPKAIAACWEMRLPHQNGRLELETNSGQNLTEAARESSALLRIYLRSHFANLDSFWQ